MMSVEYKVAFVVQGAASTVGQEKAPLTTLAMSAA
jgi:hypothetical protein